MFFYTFLPKLLNMSLTAGVVIVVVLLLQLPLRRAPKIISYALWGVVLFRLLCPVSLTSAVSLFSLLDAPAADSGALLSRIEYVPDDIVHTEYPAVALPVPALGEAVSAALPQGEEQLATDPLAAPMTIATYLWLAGVTAMAVYAAVSYIRLRRALTAASPLRDNIYLTDGIASAFVLGLIRPKIYLPSSLNAREQPYIIAHERCHIRRGDHIIKALAFAALCVHWFNPLVWLAFILSVRDMEMSCDEAVIRKMGAGVLADYASSLLNISTGRHVIAGTPLLFGEGGASGRIRNLARRRKPALWVTAAAAVVCALLAVCLLTNPQSSSAELAAGTYVSERCLYMNPLSSYAAVDGDSGFTYTVGEGAFTATDRSSGAQTVTAVPSWEWQEFPYTDEEWAALYIGGGTENLSEQYGELKYIPLTSSNFLMLANGDIWLVDLMNSQTLGACLWSIYTLTPQTAD
ncbi:MAG: M56 family metallopeptidase [Oscillospiraceae bacterium]|nr:M56 family metallopeptidase [Oscillospiraceae bacterium]